VRVARGAGYAAALVATLGVWNNSLVPRFPDLPGSYAVINGGAALVLVASARASGLTPGDLGLSACRLRAGARRGGAGAGLVAAGYGVALAVPALRPLLQDARVAALSGPELLGAVLVRIPVGTVLWEEVAFRGVLLGALLRLLPTGWAVGLGSAVFGVWHVRPTRSALVLNGLDPGDPLLVAGVAAAVVGTGLAGVLLCELRLRSGSLLAPALVHLATNCLGTLAAALALRLP
jgi:uncharacterized protein